MKFDSLYQILITKLRRPYNNKPNNLSGKKDTLRDDLMYWDRDTEFIKVYEKAAQQCGPGPKDRYYVLKELLLSLGSLNADTAECGVYKGLGSYMICYYARQLDRKEGYQHHIFDSFRGLSEIDPRDIPEPGVRHWKSGDMAGNIAEVEYNLSDFKEKRIHVGWIPDCFSSAMNNRFAFVHIDVDLYQPTKEAISFFYPRLISEGIILFDDYGFMTCPGARQALDEFQTRISERIIRLPTGQAFLIKRSRG